MKKSFVRIGIFFFFSLLLSSISFSQMTYDTTRTMFRRNVIRYNPTPSLIVGLESTVFGYERVLAPHQSVSVNIGRLMFRQFVDLGLERFDINTNRKSGGISIALDYRRYFKKRNRGFAPDGLYWGPFITYYSYKHEIGGTYVDPQLISSEVNLTANLKAYHVGVELGYQFVIAKRVTFDLILVGPSWGKYQANFDIDGSLSLDEDGEFYQAISDVIAERIPGLNTLIKDRSASKSGGFSTNTFGMRYLFQIGFLF